MKTSKIARMIGALVLLLAVSLTPLSAQDTVNTVGFPDVYTVMPGDSAWQIAGDVLHNPLLWRKIVEKNPMLQEKGRVTVNPKNGWTYVMMHPGEQIFGLESLGILPTPISISELGIKVPEPVIVREVPQWTWWILAIALAMLIACYLIYRMLTSDPVNSRSAIIPGGVNTPEAATVGFQQMAARMAGLGQYSTDPLYYQRFTVLSQVAGRIWGVLNVRYADGREVPRRLNGDRAYQARVRFDNGREEELYMLQGCGNDLRYGGISRYLPGPEFRFEADPPAVPAQPAPAPATPVAEPTPAMAPAPVAQPATEPAAATTPLTPAVVDDGSVTFEFRRSTNGKPNMIRLNGIVAEEVSFSTRGRETVLRYTELHDTAEVSK